MTQLSFLAALTRAVAEEIEAAPFDDWTDPGPPLGIESVPAWLRLPGEEGYVELDRFMRAVKP